MWQIHTRKYNSPIKKNEIMPFAATWVDPEIITLGERQRQIVYNTAYKWSPKNKIQINLQTKQKQILRRPRKHTYGHHSGK